MIQARPTTYKGIQMRSRLEALFAQTVLDSDYPGCGWTYEPRCFASETGQYLPDFHCTVSAGSTYMEVKPPGADASAALELMHIILASEPDARLFVAVSDGGYPEPQWDLSTTCTPMAPCEACDRLSSQPLLRQDGDGNLLCAWCRRPGPTLIRDGVLLSPWADDPEGEPVRALTGLKCDGCHEVFYVYISTAFPGETRLGVAGKRSDR